MEIQQRYLFTCMRATSAHILTLSALDTAFLHLCLSLRLTLFTFLASSLRSLAPPILYFPCLTQPEMLVQGTPLPHLPPFSLPLSPPFTHPPLPLSFSLTLFSLPFPRSLALSL